MVVSLEKIKPILIDYVNKNSQVQGLQWDQQLRSERLPFDPYAKGYEARKRNAHYFLLVAAITETELVGRAENSRSLMIHIHRFLGDECFKEDRVENLREIVQKSGFYSRLGTSKRQIPRLLASANRFVHAVAAGDLIEYARRFTEPEAMVTEIGDILERMGGQYIEKAWIYMRWMTRPYPDLRIFKNFSPRDLYIPLTSCIRDVAYCLGKCSEPRADLWSDPDRVEQERRRFTEFARELFPEDPLKVDYPFYMLGRWIRGEQLSLQLLMDYLQFWERVFDKIQRPPVAFDTASREESTFEQNVRAELDKLQFLFSFEPLNLNLPGDGALRYTPDFVLPKCKMNGKTVILEPHGFWTHRKKRLVKIGHRRFPIWVRPSRLDADELKFVNKLKKVRETWGGRYHIILIVPSEVKDRVENDYPDVFDEICDGEDVPKLLYNLKKHCN